MPFEMSLILNFWGIGQGSLTRFKQISLLMERVIENRELTCGLILLQTSTSTQFSGTINILCKFIAKYPLLTFSSVTATGQPFFYVEVLKFSTFNH